MTRFLTSLIFVIFLVPSVAIAEDVKYGELVKRDGVYYKKFTDLPFTGKTTGSVQGSLQDGRWDGPWVSYHSIGGLNEKGSYRNGKKEGPWVSYHSNGGLKEKGTYRNYKRAGAWVAYYENGQLRYKGNYWDGKGAYDGPWVEYSTNGQLIKKGFYINGNKVNQDKDKDKVIQKIKDQISKCWIMPSLLGNNTPNVRIQLRLNPDGTLGRPPTVIKKAEYASNLHFLAVAESAVRALLNPRCMPLALPKDQYHLWKKVILTFQTS